jgi:hypothetical protein
VERCKAAVAATLPTWPMCIPTSREQQDG